MTWIFHFILSYPEEKYGSKMQDKIYIILDSQIYTKNYNKSEKILKNKSDFS
jgi:hypothetical protein